VVLKIPATTKGLLVMLPNRQGLAPGDAIQVGGSFCPSHAIPPGSNRAQTGQEVRLLPCGIA